MSRFDVQVQEIENDPMRYVSETAVIDCESLSGVDHLQPRVRLILVYFEQERVP